MLQTYWGYSTFRPGQDKVMEAVLSGQDTLVLFPTGGGKSLCYQVPALLLDGLTIVISPLVALMEDQVSQLMSKGIRAAYINSTLSKAEVEQRLVNARNGMYRLLYMAPERLKTDLWQAEKPGLPIRLVAIDEAHCISEWGHDFRPSYRTIREDMGELPENTRWMALTATATPEVRNDLLKTLQFRDPVVVTGRFSRPNLQWWVQQTSKRDDLFVRAVKKGIEKGSGIVYANRRRDCEEWAEMFTKMGIPSKPYHAGLDAGDRTAIQQQWISNEISLVVATNAFGMGIDKPDCRFVVHHTLPLSLEAYYQEAGRAGRDGEESFPVLIFKKTDIETLKQRIHRSYPKVEQLISTYRGIADQLELAVGSEQQDFEPVPVQSISRRTGLSESVVRASIQLLQRLEILEQRELHQPRYRIQWSVSRAALLETLRIPSKKHDFLEQLMRFIPQEAFREMVEVEEKSLCESLNRNASTLQKAFHVLQEQDHLLSFRRLGEEPLIRLMTARSVTPLIDPNKAYAYRDILLQKFDYMVQYATSEGCREQFLRVYFGDDAGKPCGHCDRCEAQSASRRNEYSSKDVRRLWKLFDADPARAIHLREIRQETGWSVEKVKRVTHYMLREDILVTEPGERGLYRKK